MVKLEAQLGSSLLKAGDSRLEVGVAGLLVDDTNVNRVTLRKRGRERQHKQRYQYQGKDLLHGYTLLIIFCPLDKTEANGKRLPSGGFGNLGAPPPDAQGIPPFVDHIG